MQHVLTHLLSETQSLADHFWPSLDDAYADAFDIASTKDLLGPEHRFIVAEISRTLLHRALMEADLGPWELDAMVPRSGVHLTHVEAGHRLRVYRAMPDGAPPPAGSGRRRRFYRQDGHEQLSFDFEVSTAVPSMNLLAVWGVSAANGIWVDILRTTGSWPLGGKAKYDLRFPLPTSQTQDEEFEFFSAEEDTVFPEIEVVDDDSGEDEEAAGR